jgi:precorrin-8X/cobalt-precorrin-8 methylmutase
VTEPWLKDADAIYRLSFERAHAETDVSKLAPELHALAYRLVHSCARPEIAADIAASQGAVAAGVAALKAGAPVIVDSRMTAAGITRAFLPRDNAITCVLDDAGVADAAKAGGTTRSAAGIDCANDLLQGAVVAVGNAPTALFRLIEIARERRAIRPALVLGFPVGFVGAAEAKDALIASGLPFVTLKGRFGGSALAAAAVNALALAATGAS